MEGDDGGVSVRTCLDALGLARLVVGGIERLATVETRGDLRLDRDTRDSRR